MTAANAKYITWKGEDDAHYIMQYNEDGSQLEKTPSAGPSFLLWTKVRFDKDKPRLIDPAAAKTHDERAAFEHILKKTPKMAGFVVEDVDEHGERVTDDDYEEVEDEDVHEAPVEAPHATHVTPHHKPKKKVRKRK